jgi:gluconolactonase
VFCYKKAIFAKYKSLKSLAMKKKYLLFFLSVYAAYSFSQPVLHTPVVEKVADGFTFIEGPVWVDGLGLLFSDIPRNKILLFSIDSTVSDHITPSGNSNGLALDLQGNLLICQHGPRQLVRREANGDLTPLATHYDGKRLNSPNDLDVKSDGSVFFTDPPYGLNQGVTSELGFYGIYRLSPRGDIQLLDNSLARPNGICFSPDETKLYVSDTETRRIFVWDVVNDTTISNKRQFGFMSPQGGADGMKVDKYGYLYVAGPIGIWIYSPDGNPIDTIPVPGQTTNCGWNQDSTMLFVTSGNGLYRIRNSDQQVSSLLYKTLPETALTAFPNPFENSTQVKFSIETPGMVEFIFYNELGQVVSRPLKSFFSAGNHIVHLGSSLPKRGTYHLIMRSEDGIFSGKGLRKGFF